jgi:hypothetical protein
MNWKAIFTAIIAGLLAANGVLRLVDDSVATQVLGLLAAVGLYVLPSPLQTSPPQEGGFPRLTERCAVSVHFFLRIAAPKNELIQLRPWTAAL